MLELGKRYASERGTWIEITDRAPGRMSFERGYAPDTGKADPHLHEDFIQTWEGLGGEGQIEVDGETRSLSAGDRVAIEPGTAHRDPWLPGEGELRVRGTFEPCPEFIEAYAEAWAHHLTSGTANGQDEIPLIQILVIAQATDGKSYSARIPRVLQRATLPLVAALGRLRGYRASYD